MGSFLLLLSIFLLTTAGDSGAFGVAAQTGNVPTDPNVVIQDCFHPNITTYLKTKVLNNGKNQTKERTEFAPGGKAFHQAQDEIAKIAAAAKCRISSKDSGIQCIGQKATKTCYGSERVFDCLMKTYNDNINAYGPGNIDPVVDGNIYGCAFLNCWQSIDDTATPGHPNNKITRWPWICVVGDTQ